MLLSPFKCQSFGFGIHYRSITWIIPHTFKTLLCEIIFYYLFAYPPEVISLYLHAEFVFSNCQQFFSKEIWSNEDKSCYSTQIQLWNYLQPCRLSQFWWLTNLPNLATSTRALLCSWPNLNIDCICIWIPIL